MHWHMGARVSETEVASHMQALANIAAFANLATRLVFLLFGRPDFAKANLDIRGKLKRRSMERAGFLLRETCLVLEMEHIRQATE